MRGKVPSKKLIEESMVELIQQKPIESISVSHIVQNCGLSRQTFYNHYVDKFDIVDTIYKEAIERVMEQHPSTEPLDLVLYGQLEGIYLNQTFYRNAYCRRSDLTRFVELNRDLYRRIILPRLKTPPGERETFMVDFLADACAQRCAVWVSEGMTETPEQMCELLMLCIPNGLMRPLGL